MSLLGAVSLYETEARKVKKLKELGFNAIRTAHNPPSEALVEACDRLGMYRCGKPVAFGSANPVTDEDYTDSEAVSFRGRAMAIIRSGYEKGNGRLRISAEGFEEAETEIRVV